MTKLILGEAIVFDPKCKYRVVTKENGFWIFKSRQVSIEKIKGDKIVEEKIIYSED